MRRPQHESGDLQSADAAGKIKRSATPGRSPVTAAETGTAQAVSGRGSAAPTSSGANFRAAAGNNKPNEFGGPLGAAALTFGLPAIVLYITACTEGDWSVLNPSRLSAERYIDSKAFLIVLVWYLFQAAIYMLPVGSVIDGVPLKDGRRLAYHCNGFIALIISMAAFGALLLLRVPIDRYIADHIPQLMVASTVYAAAISTFLYVRALWAPPAALSVSATGSPTYDFYMGRELNPRIGSFDLKFFFEMRPGLIGWVVIDLALLATQASRSDSGLPSAALALVTTFHTIYVCDALWSEPAVLTTFDILHEGFGFMLAFGDLVWVPFLYTLQTRFLFAKPTEAVSYPVALAAVSALNLIGLFIFRAANNEKNQFRSSSGDGNDSVLASIATPHPGKRLLVGGWWGVCRRPNYFGDLLMSIAWCLPCGFGHGLPYFYPFYFFILLVHRQSRDEALCRQRYGDAWTEYCRRVPYKIVPYVY